MNQPTHTSLQIFSYVALAGTLSLRCSQGYSKEEADEKDTGKLVATTLIHVLSDSSDMFTEFEYLVYNAFVEESIT